MKRCPDCHRFGIVNREDGMEYCCWRECSFINTNGIDIDKVKHPISCPKFMEYLERKNNG